MMSANAISVLGKLFFEPTSAFESLKEDSKPWLPLALIIGSSLALLYWYFSAVDFSWLLEHTLSANPEMNADQREVLAKMMTKNSMMTTTLGGVLVGTLIAFALYGLYFLLAAKLMGSEITYGKWFNFSAWSSVPVLIGVPLSAMQIVSGHGQISMENLNMLSLNFLLTHFPAGHAWAGLMNSVSLTTFWSMFLTFIGLRVWTGRSSGTCAFAAVLPFLVIYGLWIAKLVFFK